MALLTTQQITAAGIAPAYTAVSSSDTVPADSSLFLHVKNGSGASINVTLVDSGVTPGGSSASSVARAVPAGQERVIAIPQSFASPATGLVTVNYSATTSVTAAVLRN